MLSTHNFKTINPAATQAPLCQSLNALVPPHYICSKTVNLSRYFWDEYAPSVSQFQLSTLNDQYLKDKSLSGYARKTPLTDTTIRNMYICLSEKAAGDEFIASTPVPCSGLFHEIISRSYSTGKQVLFDQIVETRQERLVDHGSLIEHHRGMLKSFEIDADIQQPAQPPVTFEREFIVLEYSLDAFNIGTGLVSVGMPTLSVFGLFVTTFIQRNSLSYGHIKFAVGFHSLKRIPKPSFHYPGALSRKSKIQGYVVFQCDDMQQEAHLLRKLNTYFKLSGCELTFKNVYKSNTVPQAYWMRDMEHDVNLYLKQNKTKDALDAAIHFASHNRLTAPSAAGFALFDPPVDEPKVTHLRNKHAWSEILYSLTSLVSGPLRPEYFYRHFTNGGVCVWRQP